MAGQHQMAPMAGQMPGHPGMMGAPAIPGGGIMAPGVAPGMQPGMQMMMPGSIPSAPLPVSSVAGAMQPGMMPGMQPGMGGMPVSSVGMAMPGSQVIILWKK